MLNFQQKVFKLIGQVYIFYKDVWCEKKTLQDKFYRKAIFFGFGNATFSRHLQKKLQKVSSQINLGNAQCSTKSLKIDRTSISFYKDIWYQRTTLSVEFYGIGEFFLFFFFCFFLASTG